MYASQQDVVFQEKYLKLNPRGEYVIDYPGSLRVLDFHTHMSNLIPLKGKSPDRQGITLRYPILEPLEQLNLHVPYWKNITPKDIKGIGGLARHLRDSIQILNDMSNGGTFENCFRSQDENCIEKSVLLPLSTKNNDLSTEALSIAHRYPTRFIPFCSVHPFEKGMREKVFQHKENGACGLKLKISDLEFKGKVEPLVALLKTCYEARLPVLFHTGVINTFERNQMAGLMWKLLQSTRVSIYGDLLAQLPDDFIFVFGHSGMHQYREVAAYMKRHPATFAEISTQSAKSIQYLISEVGEDRILFGSDWPALPQALTLSRVLLATEDNLQARDKILYGNAVRLLGLPESEL